MAAERFVSPALKITAVDAVGAGDSFDAGFLHEYLRGSDLTTCLASGNRAGALSVTRPGGTEAFRDKEYRERFLRAALSEPKCGAGALARPTFFYWLTSSSR